MIMKLKQAKLQDDIASRLGLIHTSSKRMHVSFYHVNLILSLSSYCSYCTLHWHTCFVFPCHCSSSGNQPACLATRWCPPKQAKKQGEKPFSSNEKVLVLCLLKLHSCSDVLLLVIVSFACFNGVYSGNGPNRIAGDVDQRKKNSKQNQGE